MKMWTVTCVSLLVGALLGFVVGGSLGGSLGGSHDVDLVARLGLGDPAPSQQERSHAQSATGDEPLYWVAPMDPNYQRDKPGKSPMGMDLVPVYASDLAGSDDQTGTVTINPAVENNLGVKTTKVEQGTLSPKIETVGYVAFDESTLWQINVRVSGWVERLNINSVGESVKKGDVLFTLYSPELVKAQEELITAYQTHRKGMINAAKERLSTLGVTKKQIRQIARRGKAIQAVDILAPADGIVATLGLREGGYLSPAQTAISAGSLDEVWVEAEVFERQSHWITQGSRAVMSVDALPTGGDMGQWQGEVDYIYPILDPTTRTLKLRLRFANPNGALKPNMFAKVAITPVTQEEVLTIPRSAVIRAGGMARVVLSLGEGKYRSARIKTGREAGNKIEVMQGLTLDDVIVTSAHFMLDSESSQSADFSRINGLESKTEASKQDAVWAQGEVTEVMADQRQLTINHQPVPEWDWPGMVMNFDLAAGIDVAAFQKGLSMDFAMQKSSTGQYQLVDYRLRESMPSQVWVEGKITMLMAEFGMVTIQHDQVEAWGWLAGEMNFSAEDAVPLSTWSEGQSIRFLVEKQGADYLLKEITTFEGEQ